MEPRDREQVRGAGAAQAPHHRLRQIRPIAGGQGAQHPRPLRGRGAPELLPAVSPHHGARARPGRLSARVRITRERAAAGLLAVAVQHEAGPRHRGARREPGDDPPTRRRPRPAREAHGFDLQRRRHPGRRANHLTTQRQWAPQHRPLGHRRDREGAEQEPGATRGERRGKGVARQGDPSNHGYHSPQRVRGPGGRHEGTHHGSHTKGLERFQRPSHVTACCTRHARDSRRCSVRASSVSTISTSIDATPATMPP